MASTARAGEGLWSLGLRTQGVVDFEPGQDLFEGPEIGYSDYNLFSHSLQLRGAYLTNRLEAAFRPAIIRQDYFLFSPVWHFRRRAIFDPTLQADLGYWRYDTESEIFKDLDNSSWVASIQVGFALNLFQGEYGLYYHFGYNLITPDSGLLFPGVFGVGFWKII
ncbi:MAG: hypothetical protein JF616_15350 [Fibrobacteres bacterium]|nr:hypothetical protein [Fibrobacterota bacterium]